MRDRLIELIEQAAIVMDCPTAEETADYLLDNGVIVPPCKVGGQFGLSVTKKLSKRKLTRLF